MKKNVFTKCMAAALALAFAFSAVNCAGHTVDPDNSIIGEEDNSNKTVIRVTNFGGGVGREWLDKAAERFEDAYADKVYEEGKKGVSVAITSSIATNVNSMETSGEHIYFDQSSVNIASYIQAGKFLNITDVVTELTEDTRNGEKVSIEDKIAQDKRYMYKGNDGDYYCLPHYEFYDGLTYDVQLFENEGLYLADSASEGTAYKCDLVGKTFYFVKSESSKKSCGTDGEYNTQDDGLPTTLEEFIALCDYMKQEKFVVPFTVAGGHTDYSSYTILGMWAALSGYEQTTAAFTFDSEDVETITGFSNDNLFSGIGNIKKPVTEKVAVTEKTGYLAYNQAGKYYALAFMQLAEEQGWISKRSTQGTHLHVDAMRDFIFNGVGQYEEIGMIMEGSYWINEAEDNDIFADYEDMLQSGEKELAWMPLPTSLNEPVTAGNGREMPLINGVATYAFINGNLDDKPDTEGIIAASKDFLRFCYTDEELKNFIKQSGSTKANIDVEIDEEILGELSSAQKSVMEYRAHNRVVQQDANNPTLIASTATLTYGIDKGFRPYINGVKYTAIINAVRAGYSAQDCFEALEIPTSAWLNSYYKGND